MVSSIDSRASDLHLSVDLPPMMRIDGRLVKMEYAQLPPSEIQRLVYEVLSNPQNERTRAFMSKIL